MSKMFNHHKAASSMASMACIWWWLLSSSPSDAFSCIRSDRRLGTAVFSFNPQQNSYRNDGYDNNNYNDNRYSNSNNNNRNYNRNNNNNYNQDPVYDVARERFKMVKQFNGDYKTVPIDEYYEQTTRRNSGRESIASEYGILRATRGANPYLTSPAREMGSKQWEWQRPPPGMMKPRFRQVQTFSGDVKTVREDENPFLDGRVLKNQYGRVDGTGYVPDMGPETASTLRYAPSRGRMDYGEPVYRGPPMYEPPGGGGRDSSMYEQRGGPPPMYAQRGPPPFPPPPPPPSRQGRQDRRRDRDYEDMRRRDVGVDPRYVGDEFRREMRKYRRDDMDEYPPDPNDYYSDGGRNRKTGFERFAQEAEKVLKSVTSVGGPYPKRDSRRQRKRDMDYLRRASSSDPGMMYPPMEPPLPPPPPDMRYNNNNDYYYGGGGGGGGPMNDRNAYSRPGNGGGSYDSSRAVRSFEQQQRPPPPQQPRTGYYPGPRQPYQSRQYDGSRYSDDSYDNPGARSEGHRW